jgi:hypothetical protein
MPESAISENRNPGSERPENCTCGTRLAENARFCHLCGRPVFADYAPEAPPQAQPLAVQPQAIPAISAAARAGSLPVGFGNPVALRVAILMSLGTMLLEMIPGVNLLFIVWALGAGWCAVLLYRRLTGYALSVKAGARLGSLTGVLTFLSLLIMTTLTMAVMGKDVMQQIKQDPRMAQVPSDPAAMVASFLVVMLILFALVVGICAAGGALGARFAGRNSTNNGV